MKCIYCGAELSGENFCRNCGADVSIQKRIIRISNLLYNRGLEKATVRDLSGAESLLRQSLKFNKENIDARNLLGLCYFETGEAVLALVEWVISSNMKPENNLARTYLEDLQSNKNRLDTINSTIRKYNQSIEYCRSGNEDMAVMQLKKVIVLNPKMVKAYQLLALLYMKFGEWDRAGRLLKKAVQIDNTNTTTLRYLSFVRAEKGKHSLLRRRSGNGPAAAGEKSLRYVSGNDIIIAPTTFRDSSTIATVINIFLGILLGAAIVWFLTVPQVRQSVNDQANKSVTDANTSLATVTASMQDMQDQIDSANAKADEAEKEKQNANDQVKGYADLLKVADLYVLGDQTKTVEALGKLNADDYDGEGKTLYDDISSMVGDALFNQYYNEGTSSYVAKDYQGAAASLQQAVDSDPQGENANYHNALYYLGFAYYYSGDYTKADDVFTQFSQRYPNEAATVSPYMNGGAGQTAAGSGQSASGSQGEASVNTDNAASQSAGSLASSAQSSGSSQAQSQASSGSDITVYGNDSQSSAGNSQQTQAQIVWTDPYTGQGYDMYGNPVYAQ